MSRFRFDLKLLLSLMSVICVMAWAVSAESILGVLASIILFAAVFAWLGKFYLAQTVVLGAIGGAIGTWLLFCGFWITHIAGYFMAGRPADYFEDGIHFELITTPFISLMIFVPIGAVIGLVIGAGVWMLRRLRRSKELLDSR